MKKYISLFVALLSVCLWIGCTEDEMLYAAGNILEANNSSGEMPESMRSDYLNYTTSMYFKQERPVDTYWYPVYPGTEAWKELWQEGMLHVLSVIRIPENRLQSMSTPGLLQSFLDYPFTSEMTYISSESDMFSFFHWFEICNHSYFIEEMKNRADMGKTVVQFMDCYDNQAENALNSNYYLFDILLALVVPGKDFYNQLNDSNQLSALLNALARHIECKDGEYGLPRNMRGHSYINHTIAVLFGSIFHDEMDNWIKSIESLEGTDREFTKDELTVERFLELFGENWNAEAYFDRMVENDDQEILRTAVAFYNHRMK